MDDLWLPPSARSETTQIGDGIEVTPMDSESLDRMLGPDDAIFLPASRFEVAEWDEPDEFGRTTLPAAHVNFERMRQRVIDGTLNLDFAGIAEGITHHSGEVIPFPDGPQLYVRLDDCHIYVATAKAPEGWLDLAWHGFMLVFEPLPDGRSPWFATHPFKRLGLSIGGAPRGGTRAVGRNQPCPCGSGLKFKRCCGR